MQDRRNARPVPAPCSLQGPRNGEQVFSRRRCMLSHSSPPHLPKPPRSWQQPFGHDVQHGCAYSAGTHAGDAFSCVQSVTSAPPSQKQSSSSNSLGRGMYNFDDSASITSQLTHRALAVLQETNRRRFSTTTPRVQKHSGAAARDRVLVDVQKQEADGKGSPLTPLRALAGEPRASPRGIVRPSVPRAQVAISRRFLTRAPAQRTRWSTGQARSLLRSCVGEGTSGRGRALSRATREESRSPRARVRCGRHEIRGTTTE